MVLIGAEGEALAQGIVYLRVVSSVFALSSVMFIGNSCLRGAGDTRTPLRLIGVVQPFLAAMMVFAGSLRGAGDTLTPMLINGGGVWLLRVPLSIVATQVLGWGLTGVWMVMALDLTLRGCFLFAYFRRGRWKTKQI